jgi:RNA recognition motif-containing protein
MHVPNQTKERDLEDEFSRYGKIADIFLPLNEEGQSRGFAFVTFDEERDAEEAIDALDEYVHFC